MGVKFPSLLGNSIPLSKGTLCDVVVCVPRLPESPRDLLPPLIHALDLGRPEVCHGSTLIQPVFHSRESNPSFQDAREAC